MVQPTGQKRPASEAGAKYELAVRQGAMAADYQRRFAQLYAELGESVPQNRSPPLPASGSPLQNSFVGEQSAMEDENRGNGGDGDGGEKTVSAMVMMSEQERLNQDSLLTALNHERSR